MKCFRFHSKSGARFLSKRSVDGHHRHHRQQVFRASHPRLN